jgi:hypothetical protein
MKKGTTMKDPAKSGSEVVNIHALINNANRHITNGLKNFVLQSKSKNR